MDNHSDIVIIGGGPAAMITALTARRYYPEKSITMIKNKAADIIPCGIPYMFHSLEHPAQNAMSSDGLSKNNIAVVIDEAKKIDRETHQVTTAQDEVYPYEKLVLAIGSVPIIPPIGGIDLEGIYPIEKDLEYIQDMVKNVKEAENVLIVGGGFIGVELADEITSLADVRVHLVEMLPHLLAHSFDTEYAQMVEEKLESRGVQIYTNTGVQEFSSDGNGKTAHLADGTDIPIDYAILGIGARPNTDLAEQAGLSLFDGSGIWVDEYMRTTDPDIFAVGDCAVKRDFFTREKAPVMLASTATAEARIAGANLYKLKVVRENKGTIAIYSTYVDGLVLGSAGLTEHTATAKGFEVKVGTAHCVDKHPGVLPDTHQCQVKLIFSRNSEIIMGGQVAGGSSACEMINTIGGAIQQRTSRSEFETMQMATHPFITAAPTQYPLVIAAQNANS